jgi:cytochrome c2
VDRISATILGFGLPAIFIFVVWATAGSIYQTTSAPPPAPAPEQTEEAAAEDMATEETAPAEEAPAEEAPAEEAPAEEAPVEETAEAEAPAEEAPAEETAEAEAPAEEAPAEETAEAEAPAEAAPAEETAEAEAPAEEAPAEETAEAAPEGDATAEDAAAAEAPAEGEAAEEMAAAQATPANESTEAPAEANIDLATLVEAGDVRAGSRVWRQCSACHVADQAQNRVGPHLVDVIGRERSSIEGFNYSDALQALEGIWTPEEISAYIADPAEYAPGNRMSFRGLDDPEDRANVLAYLADLQLQNGD